MNIQPQSGVTFRMPYDPSKESRPRRSKKTPQDDTAPDPITALGGLLVVMQRLDEGGLIPGCVPPFINADGFCDICQAMQDAQWALSDAKHVKP